MNDKTISSQVQSGFVYKWIQLIHIALLITFISNTRSIIFQNNYYKLEHIYDLLSNNDKGDFIKNIFLIKLLFLIKRNLRSNEI